MDALLAVLHNLFLGVAGETLSGVEVTGHAGGNVGEEPRTAGVVAGVVGALFTGHDGAGLVDGRGDGGDGVDLLVALFEGASGVNAGVEVGHVGESSVELGDLFGGHVTVFGDHRVKLGTERGTLLQQDFKHRLHQTYSFGFVWICVTVLGASEASHRVRVEW